MRAPDDFTLGKCLYIDARCEVYAAVRDSDGCRLALKYYTRDRLAQARSELAALTALAGRGIVPALELLESADGPVLALDRLEGLSLREWVEERIPAEDQFLEVAIDITQALIGVHAAHWLHQELRPEHVVVDPASLQVQLGGFGRAQPFGGIASPEGPQTKTGKRAEALLFAAPEQTGRMGRGVDARSDLYSLGATLYFCLTGKPPFESDDALALVHAHMARLPVSPLAHRPRLSSTLGRIVMKLLQKQPEDRYQTATALHRDLFTCREQLARTSRIDDELPLGTADIPVRPLFRKNLYGREPEIAALQSAYERAVRGGSELVSLRGVAGSGKSSLVQDLRRLLPAAGSYLAAAKFDPYRRDVPYAGISAAFTALLDQIFTESDARVARWRSDLQAALGGLAGVLADLIPELTLLLGDLTPAPALGPSETVARLAIAVERFVRACAARDHPLVLFLDDVQWADPGTLELIETLILHGAAHHLLVVVAYREEEVGPDHPVALLSTRLAQRAPNACCISLDAISLDSTIELLADALSREREAMRELAATILRKTGGVPFLIQQFTLHLHAVGLIRFEETTGWTWDPAAVELAPIPEGAVGLVSAKLERLDADARAILQFASCVAYEFDVGMLHELSGRPREPLETALRSIAEEGLIAPCPRGFRFVHDRVREAAQTMLSAEERARAHLKVAEYLLATLDAEAIESRIFEVLEHLNGGLACVPESLRLRLVELNTEAGRRSLGAGAAATALHYLTIARRSFEALNANEHRKLHFELLLLCAESTFRSGDTAAALELLAPLERDPLSKLESARVIGLRVQIYALTRAPMDCVRYSLLELRKFGVHWSLRPSRRRVLKAVRDVQRMLRDRPDDGLLAPATTLDLDKLATFLLIDLTGASLAQADSRFPVLAACHVLSDYLRHGYIARPGFTLAAYASCSFWLHLDAELAARVGHLALEWCERVPDPLWDPRTTFMIHALLDSWLKPRRETTPPLQATRTKMWEVGDTEWLYHADAMLLLNDLLAGTQVAETDARIAELAKAAERDFRYSDFEYLRQVYRPLVEQHPDAVRLDVDVFAEELPRGVGWESNAPMVRTAWLMVLSVYGQHERVLAESELGRREMYRHSPWAHNADSTFYRGLAAAALAAGRFPWTRTRRILREALRELRQFATHGPDFVHMAEILEAEQTRLAGDTTRARRLYQSGAQNALRQQFVHHAALAHERHASMLRGLRRDTEAVQVLKQAITAYSEWGARAKARSLEALIPE